MFGAVPVCQQPAPRGERIEPLKRGGGIRLGMDLTQDVAKVPALGIIAAPLVPVVRGHCDEVLTNNPDDLLVDVAKSWNNPPELQLKGSGFKNKG